MNKIEDFGTKRKRNYPQIGNPTIRMNDDGTIALTEEGHKVSMRKVVACVVAALAVAATGIVLFSLLGAAVFLLPLIGGAFKK